MSDNISTHAKEARPDVARSAAECYSHSSGVPNLTERQLQSQSFRAALTRDISKEAAQNKVKGTKPGVELFVAKTLRGRGDIEVATLERRGHQRRKEETSQARTEVGDRVK